MVTKRCPVIQPLAQRGRVRVTRGISPGFNHIRLNGRGGPGSPVSLLLCASQRLNNPCSQMSYDLRRERYGLPTREYVSPNGGELWLCKLCLLQDGSDSAARYDETRYSWNGQVWIPHASEGQPVLYLPIGWLDKGGGVSGSRCVSEGLRGELLFLPAG